MRTLLAVFALLLACGPARSQVLAPLGPLDDGRVSYFIAEPAVDASARAGDVDLARWALEAWQRAAAGALAFVPAATEEEALVRVYWVPAAAGQYGEMRALDLNGRRGAEVFIRPDMSALGPQIASRAELDVLFRDTVVYLTCLHELGHALGLAHTADFEDVMYFFGFGGNLGEFFGRYRRTLQERPDIRGSSGMSAGDVAQLRALYGSNPSPGQLAVAN